MRLQCIDSRIVARVINAFTRAGVPCLPVHDSLIVPAAYEDDLREVMQQSYRRELGFPIPIAIKS